MATHEASDDALLTARQIAKARGLPVIRSTSTWSEWMRSGVKIDGRVRKLPVTVIAGRRHTTLAAIREFFADHDLDRVSNRGNKIKERK